MANKRSLSKKAKVKAEYVSEIIYGLKKYWPLTLRQIYYRLVAEGYIENNYREYSKLSALLVNARFAGIVPWGAIEDRARSIMYDHRWQSADEFIKWEKKFFLNGYRIDPMLSQPTRLEVWTEKDALSKICHEVASKFGIPVVVARGYSSVSYLYECSQRVESGVADEGRPTTILYFGDLDPSGWNMLPAMMDTLKEIIKISAKQNYNIDIDPSAIVQSIRCALNLNQVSEYELPKNPNALKLTDTRAKKYIERFGDLAVELDALHPDDLKFEIQKAIISQIDLEILEKTKAQEAKDIKKINRLRKKVDKLMKGNK